MIDFTELPMDGNVFELLMRELLSHRGLEVYWTGRGPDGGKDLICIEHIKGNFDSITRRWVDQCKHKAHSRNAVGQNEVDSIENICSTNNAEGYLLACTTYPSSSLMTMIDGIRSNRGISVQVWDYNQIEKELQLPQNWDIANTFFPISMKKTGLQVSYISSNFWYVFFKGYIFYLSARISSNYVFFVSDIEDCLNEIHQINDKMTEGFKIRVRGIYVDDKNCSFKVYVDFMLPERIEDDEINHALQILRNYQWNGKDINGMFFVYDLAEVQYNPYSDHFDYDSRMYYDPYVEIMKSGLDRDVKRPLMAHEKYGFDYTEGFIEKEFNKLCDVFKRIPFICYLNSGNAKIERINSYCGIRLAPELEDYRNQGIGDFFSAEIRFEINNNEDYEKFSGLLANLPNGATGIMELKRNYIVLPEEGIRNCEDECIYTLSFTVNSACYNDKFQFRKLINSYFREITDVLEDYLRNLEE